MSLFKRPGRAGNKEQRHHRSQYLDHSLKFLDWVNSLSFEKTFLGKWFLLLERRFSFRRLGIVVAFSFCLASVLYFNLDFTFEADVGDIASKDIKSPLAIQLIDEETTKELRRRAELKVPPVLDFDPQVFDQLTGDVYRAFRAMRVQLMKSPIPSGGNDRDERIKDFAQYKSKFTEILKLEIPDRLFEWLTERKFNAQVENVVIRFLDKYAGYKVVEGLDGQFFSLQDQVIIRPFDRRSTGEEYAISRDRVKDLARPGSFDFTGVRGFEKFSEGEQNQLQRLGVLLLKVNSFINQSETSRRRKQAREAVPASILSFKPNQIIVGEGSVIQPVHIRVLNEIQRAKSPQRADLMAVASAMLFVVLILVFFSFLRRFTLNRVRVDARDLMAMGVVTLIVVVVCKVFLFVTNNAFIAKYGTLIPLQTFLLAAPVAAGPMLVGLMITSGEVVWLFTVFQATVLSIMVDMNFTFLVVSIIAGIAGARGVFNCKKRNDVYFAGIRSGLIAAFCTTLLLVIEKFGSTDFTTHLLWAVPGSFFGGMFSAFVAMMFIPLLESLFNYTTDVKLMELSNLNHPLLQEMIVKSPGTYHHSLVVGSMCEAAAQEIAANPMLAKVMAYYHDIGKMGHAAYFIENQKPGHNPHDHLSPHMSKTILIAHVKDGVELGLQYKLGKPIIDGIIQHHGTTLISFFYNKALEDQDEDIDHVNEVEFRYPGPKPQFREAALIMLADSIEAAARSLDEPTPTRLRNIVKNIIQRKFMDGQLDECNLTLKDLSVIENSFVRILLGIYHQRIDYPKSAGGGASELPRIHPKRKGAHA